MSYRIYYMVHIIWYNVVHIMYYTISYTLWVWCCAMLDCTATCCSSLHYTSPYPTIPLPLPLPLPLPCCTRIHFTTWCDSRLYHTTLLYFMRWFYCHFKQLTFKTFTWNNICFVFFEYNKAFGGPFPLNSKCTSRPERTTPCNTTPHHITLQPDFILRNFILRDFGSSFLGNSLWNEESSPRN